MASGSAARRGVPKLAGVYLPKHFTARDQAAVEAFVDDAGAADLVTFDGTKPVASLIPIIWDRPAGAQDGAGAGENGHGRLVGHLALANPRGRRRWRWPSCTARRRTYRRPGTPARRGTARSYRPGTTSACTSPGG